MNFGSTDGRRDSEHNVVRLVVISKIFASHDDVLYGAAIFNKVCFSYDMSVPQNKTNLSKEIPGFPYR